MSQEKFVTLSEIIEEMDLRDLTPDVDSDVKITVPDIHRPGLQLAGFFEHFPSNRIQVIGNVEHAYLSSLGKEEREKAFKEYIEKGIPCIIYTYNNMPQPELIRIATEHNVPILGTDRRTSVFGSNILWWITSKLAPTIGVHGVLMDVFGEGILITGESGIGKSETALELVKRGHRLVSDDIVLISKAVGGTLIGSAPEVTRHLIEVRGIGILDIKTLFGMESVENSHAIDMVVNFVEWDKEAVYDRIGAEEEYAEYLETKIICHRVPVRPGRNLAVIVETAALNSRQKSMGYSATDELYRRLAANLTERRN